MLDLLLVFELGIATGIILTLTAWYIRNRRQRSDDPLPPLPRRKPVKAVGTFTMTIVPGGRLPARPVRPLEEGP
jgi:hypothetical protein